LGLPASLRGQRCVAVGQPVEVLRFDYEGNERRGLTAVWRRADGTEHVVASSELVILPSAQGGRYLAAYRKWMGIAPSPPSTRRATGRKTIAPAPSVEGHVELLVLSVKQKAARCHLLGSDQAFTFGAGRLWELVYQQVPPFENRLRAWRSGLRPMRNLHPIIHSAAKCLVESSTPYRQGHTGGRIGITRRRVRDQRRHSGT
jgi:hypothetical protein